MSIFCDRNTVKGLSIINRNLKKVHHIKNSLFEVLVNQRLLNRIVYYYTTRVHCHSVL